MFNVLSNVHKLSFNNKEEISRANQVGCFGCIKKFDAKEVTTFKDEKHGICPYCKKDTLIADKVIKKNFILPLRLDKKMFKKLNETFDTSTQLGSP